MEDNRPEDFLEHHLQQLNHQIDVLLRRNGYLAQLNDEKQDKIEQLQERIRHLEQCAQPQQVIVERESQSEQEVEVSTVDIVQGIKMEEVVLSPLIIPSENEQSQVQGVRVEDAQTEEISWSLDCDSAHPLSAPGFWEEHSQSAGGGSGVSVTPYVVYIDLAETGGELSCASQPESSEVTQQGDNPP